MISIRQKIETGVRRVFASIRAKPRFKESNLVPPVSHPFKKGAMVVLMNYNDHAPPHVHVKYQGQVGGYRIEIRTRAWMKPGGELPPALRKLVESWVEAHESELLEQWENARQHRPVAVVG